MNGKYDQNNLKATVLLVSMLPFTDYIKKHPAEAQKTTIKKHRSIHCGAFSIQQVLNKY